MSAKNYYEIKVYCPAKVGESICAFLIEHGALGAVEQNIFVDRVKKRKATNRVTGYFEGENDFLRIRSGLKRFLDALKRNFTDFKHYRIVRRSLEARNWREGYKKHFEPVKVSRRIVARPDYADYRAAKDEQVILINPQMAFGIGSHPTTKMCVKYVDELIAGHDDPGELRILDAGTGTGIIAIAAAKLGAGHVYGFDIDKTSYETARGNVKKNGAAASVKLGCHGIEKVTGKYDIVVANILANVLVSLKDKLVRAVKRGGALILSGILETQKDDLLRAFLAGRQMKLVSIKREKEWITLKLTKAAGAAF